MRPAPVPVRSRHPARLENRNPRSLTLLFAAGLAASRPAAAQTEAWINLGASIVEYDGFLASGAFVAAPAVQFESRRVSAAGLGNWTIFESGNNVLQALATGAWLAADQPWFRLELSGSAGIASYASEAATGHVLGGARLHFFAPQTGGWVSLITGQTHGGPPGTPVEVMAAGWHIRNRVAWVGTVTLVSYGSIEHVDLLGAMRWAGPRLELEARAGVRPWAEASGADEPFTGPYGEISAVFSFSRWVGLSFGAGKYPPDPVRQTLGAEYIGVGLRLRPFGRPAPRVPVYTTGVLRGRSIPASASGPRLEVEGEAERRTIRVHAPGAGVVEIMGDFTDWAPVALLPTGGGRWEIRLPVASGVHRVNLRLDRGPWIVPSGLRIEQTEFGGTVGLLVLP